MQTGRPALERQDVPSLWLWAGQCLCLLLLGISVWAAWREGGPFMQRLAPITDQASELLDREPAPARWFEVESRFARRARLDTCLKILNQASLVPSPNDEVSGVNSLRRACLDIARNNISAAPASSNDWLIASSLAGQLGDADRSRAYLARSVATGPNEEWIAERRIRLAAADQPADPAITALLDQDLAMMLQSNRGIQQLAEIYVYDAAMRARIADVAETVPPFYQNRFLLSVRKISKQW